ncbi:hypothetical protein LXL04_037600 [Taraxacum kok-saghyz]
MLLKVLVAILIINIRRVFYSRATIFTCNQAVFAKTDLAFLYFPVWRHTSLIFIETKTTVALLLLLNPGLFIGLISSTSLLMVLLTDMILILVLIGWIELVYESVVKLKMDITSKSTELDEIDRVVFKLEIENSFVKRH